MHKTPGSPKQANHLRNVCRQDGDDAVSGGLSKQSQSTILLPTRRRHSGHQGHPSCRVALDAPLPPRQKTRPSFIWQSVEPFWSLLSLQAPRSSSLKGRNLGILRQPSPRTCLLWPDGARLGRTAQRRSWGPLSELCGQESKDRRWDPCERPDPSKQVSDRRGRARDLFEPPL